MAIIKLQGEAEKRNHICYQFNSEEPPIGEGGMGKVFKGVCVDERTGVSRPVAIKFMFDDLPANAYERARREAEIQLRNDNLVEMLGFIEISDRNNVGEVVTHYHVVSELLTGVSLSDILNGKTQDRNGQDVPFAVKLLTDYKKDPERFAKVVVMNVLSGLMALHDAGYIHRDIDPSNIMVTTDEQFHEVYLIDFGAVAHPQKRDGGSTVAGTFGYMPPEQIFGNIAIQSDFYALGATMLHMLTGIFPGEISAQVYQIDVPAILREKAPDASPNMTALLASMLSADIDKRPPTAEQLCKSLDHVLAYPKDGFWQKISEKFAAMDNQSHRMMRSPKLLISF